MVVSPRKPEFRQKRNSPLNSPWSKTYTGGELVKLGQKSIFHKRSKFEKNGVDDIQTPVKHRVRRVIWLYSPSWGKKLRGIQW